MNKKSLYKNNIGGLKYNKLLEYIVSLRNIFIL